MPFFSILQRFDNVVTVSVLPTSALLGFLEFLVTVYYLAILSNVPDAFKNVK